MTSHWKRFDSILVRLKEAENEWKEAWEMLFRFHTGSIKSASGLNLHDFSVECFDSILVRLKGSLDETIEVLASVFRFHTGSIKRSVPTDYSPSAARSFDSILVRLKVTGKSDAAVRQALVSIPYWFD